MAKNKYKVEISYLIFMFDDREVALDFAETVFNSCTNDRAVTLSIVEEEDDNE